MLPNTPLNYVILHLDGDSIATSNKEKILHSNGEWLGQLLDQGIYWITHTEDAAGQWKLMLSLGDEILLCSLLIQTVSKWRLKEEIRGIIDYMHCDISTLIFLLITILSLLLPSWHFRITWLAQLQIYQLSQLGEIFSTTDIKWSY